jgi:hypothetical protein
MSQRIVRKVIHGTVTRQSQVNMFKLDRGARQLVAQTTTQQGRPQGTVLRLYRQVINADYDNRVQDDYLR